MEALFLQTKPTILHLLHLLNDLQQNGNKNYEIRNLEIELQKLAKLIDRPMDFENGALFKFLSCPLFIIFQISFENSEKLMNLAELNFRLVTKLVNEQDLLQTNLTKLIIIYRKNKRIINLIHFLTKKTELNKELFYNLTEISTNLVQDSNNFDLLMTLLNKTYLVLPWRDVFPGVAKVLLPKLYDTNNNIARDSKYLALDCLTLLVQHCSKDSEEEEKEEKVSSSLELWREFSRQNSNSSKFENSQRHKMLKDTNGGRFFYTQLTSSSPNTIQTLTNFTSKLFPLTQNSSNRYDQKLVVKCFNYLSAILNLLLLEDKNTTDTTGLHTSNNNHYRSAVECVCKCLELSCSLLDYDVLCDNSEILQRVVNGIYTFETTSGSFSMTSASTTNNNAIHVNHDEVVRKINLVDQLKCKSVELQGSILLTHPQSLTQLLADPNNVFSLLSLYIQNENTTAVISHDNTPIKLAHEDVLKLVKPYNICNWLIGGKLGLSGCLSVMQKVYLLTNNNIMGTNIDNNNANITMLAYLVYDFMLGALQKHTNTKSVDYGQVVEAASFVSQIYNRLDNKIVANEVIVLILSKLRDADARGFAHRMLYSLLLINLHDVEKNPLFEVLARQCGCSGDGLGGLIHLCAGNVMDEIILDLNHLYRSNVLEQSKVSRMLRLTDFMLSRVSIDNNNNNAKLVPMMIDLAKTTFQFVHWNFEPLLLIQIYRNIVNILDEALFPKDEMSEVNEFFSCDIIETSGSVSSLTGAQPLPVLIDLKPEAILPVLSNLIFMSTYLINHNTIQSYELVQQSGLLLYKVVEWKKEKKVERDESGGDTFKIQMAELFPILVCKFEVYFDALKASLLKQHAIKSRSSTSALMAKTLRKGVQPSLNISSYQSLIKQVLSVISTLVKVDQEFLMTKLHTVIGGLLEWVEYFAKSVEYLKDDTRSVDFFLNTSSVLSRWIASSKLYDYLHRFGSTLLQMLESFHKFPLIMDGDNDIITMAQDNNDYVCEHIINELKYLFQHLDADFLVRELYTYAGRSMPVCPLLFAPEQHESVASMDSYKHDTCCKSRMEIIAHDLLLFTEQLPEQEVS